MKTTTKNGLKIFIVEDDVMYQKTITKKLNELNLNAKCFNTGEECLEHLHEAPDVIILDYFLDSQNKNALNGLEVLKKIKELNPEIYVIILSGQDNIEVAVNSVREGAFGYIVKNTTAFVRLDHKIKNIFRLNELERKIKASRKMTILALSFVVFLGFSVLVLKLICPALI